MQNWVNFDLIRSICPTWSVLIKTPFGHTEDGIMSLNLLQLDKVGSFWHK